MVIPLALGLLLAAKLKTEVAQFAYAFALSMPLGPTERLFQAPCGGICPPLSYQSH